MSPSSRHWHCPASLSTLRRLTSSNLACPRQSLPRPRDFGTKSGLLLLTKQHQPQQSKQSWQSRQFRASDWSSRSWSRSQFHTRRSASGIWCVSLHTTTRTLSFPPSPSPSSSSFNSSDISISLRLSFSARRQQQTATTKAKKPSSNQARCLHVSTIFLLLSKDPPSTTLATGPKSPPLLDKPCKSFHI